MCKYFLKALYNGHPLPGWDRVTPEIKAGWIKAAAAVQEISKGEITNLKDQIDELQAEVEGLAKTKRCHDCQHYGAVDGVPSLCQLEAHMQFNSITQDSYLMQVTPEFGCQRFASKGGN